jgi:hypothetical protein
MRTAGSCFGAAVATSVELEFLRLGGGDRRLTVEELPAAAPLPAGAPLIAFTGTGADGRPARAALHRSAGGRLAFGVEDVGTYLIDPAASWIGLPPCDDRIRREQMLWNVPAMLCALARQEMCIHAAAVEVGDGAVLLAAPGRYGKTTLALAFHEAGLRMLAEDVAIVRPATAEVLPGPALLRVRDGLLDGAVPAGVTVAATRIGRTELSIATDRRGSGDAVPLRGIVLLRQSERGIWFDRAAPGDVVRDLFALGFHLPGDGSQAACFRAAADLSTLPAWNLHRPLRRDELPDTVTAIVEQVAA